MPAAARPLAARDQLTVGCAGCAPLCAGAGVECHAISLRGTSGTPVDQRSVKITEHVEEKMDRSFGPVRCTIHLEPKDYVEEGITYSGTHG